MPSPDAPHRPPARRAASLGVDRLLPDPAGVGRPMAGAPADRARRRHGVRT